MSYEDELKNVDCISSRFKMAPTLRTDGYMVIKNIFLARACVLLLELNGKLTSKHTLADNLLSQSRRKVDIRRPQESQEA